MQGLLLRAKRLAFIHTSPGVDNQANYAHSPPKSCCTATAKPVRCVEGRRAHTHTLTEALACTQTLHRRVPFTVHLWMIKQSDSLSHTHTNTHSMRPCMDRVYV